MLCILRAGLHAQVLTLLTNSFAISFSPRLSQSQAQYIVDSSRCSRQADKFRKKKCSRSKLQLRFLSNNKFSAFRPSFYLHEDLKYKNVCFQVTKSLVWSGGVNYKELWLVITKHDGTILKTILKHINFDTGLVCISSWPLHLVDHDTHLVAPSGDQTETGDSKQEGYHSILRL